MKYMKLYPQWGNTTRCYENFDWSDEDFDFEEENDNFEYVSTDQRIHNYNIYISLKTTKNGNLLLFDDKWTNGWNPNSFRPLNNVELDRIKKDENIMITFYNKQTKKWERRSYINFIKKYPQFKI